MRRKCRLLDDRLQIFKYRIIEKLPDADLQPIANLLNGHDARIFAFGVQHTVNRGWSHATHVCKRIDRNPTLQTERMDAPGNGLFCVHCGTTFPAHFYATSLIVFAIYRVGYIPNPLFAIEYGIYRRKEAVLSIAVFSSATMTREKNCCPCWPRRWNDILPNTA